MWQHDLITAGVPGIVGLAGIWGTLPAPYRSQHRLALRAERRSFRRARRLVLEELETIEMHLRLLIENGSIPLRDLDQLLPTTVWERHRDALAECLGDNDWAGVPAVMWSVARHRMILRDRPTGSPLTPDDLRNLVEAAELVHGVRELLERATPIDD